VPTTHRYRLLQGASWAIAVTLQGEAAPAASLPPGAMPVAGRVWLRLDVGWQPGDEEIGFLQLGLRLVAPAIERAWPGGGPVLVHLTGLEYNPCDYQPEGLAAAVAEWAALECGFPKPVIPAAFDPARRRYVDAFPAVGQNQVDEPVAHRAARGA
jgi:hypothetical protein